jgi:hypothetical protein
MGHSMGANFFQYFLAFFVTQEWKDKYISSLISLGGSFHGVSNAYKLIKGDNYGLPLLDERKMVPIIRQVPSVLWMLPPLNSRDYVVYTPAKNYTNADLQELLKDLNSTASWDLYNYEMSAGDRVKPPGVPVHCVYGYDVRTGTGMFFSSLNPPAKEEGKWLNGSDGDGTVPLYSLSACDGFAAGQDKPVQVHRLQGAKHIEMVHEQRLWELISGIVAK